MQKQLEIYLLETNKIGYVHENNKVANIFIYLLIHSFWIP